MDTLRRCVESLGVGTTDDYEVVLVDDGSTDGTHQLCDQLAAADRHITAIHTPNRGPSAARNTGLQRATGDVVYFADADDYLQKGTLDSLLPMFVADHETDIIEFPAMVYYRGKRQWLLQLAPRDYTDAREYWLDTHGYAHTFVWNKLFRRRLFEGERFCEGQIFEDAELMPRLLEKARRIVTTDRGFYYYCDNPLSLTARNTPHELTWLLDAYAETFRRWGFQDDRRATGFFLQMLNVQIDAYGASQEIRIPNCAWRMSMGETAGFREKIKLFLARILGIKGLCKTYRLMRRGR